MKRERGAIDYLRSLWRYAGRRLPVALSLMGLVAITEGIGLVLLVPFLHLVGIDSGAPPGGAGGQLFAWFAGGPAMLPWALLAFAALVTVRALLIWRRDVVINTVQYGFTDDLRLRLFRAASEASWAFLAQASMARLGHVLTVDISRVGQGTHYLLQMAVVAGLIVAHLVVAFMLSPTMTLLALATALCLVGVLWPQVRRSRRLGEALSEDGRRVFEAVSEFQAGLKLAKSFVNEARHYHGFAAGVRRMRERMLDFVRSRAAAQAIYQVGAAVSLALLVYIAARVVRVPGASLLVLALVFARLLPLIAQMQRGWQHTVNMLPAWREAEAFVDECEAAAESHAELAPLPMHRSVALRGVRFRYPGKRDIDAIRELDLDIAAGSSVAVIGPSGAGKTTLVDLLQGLLSPSNGSLCVDGCEVDATQLRAWRRSVAYVPQETLLFNDSVRNNLLWVDPNADEQAMWQVLAQAAVDGVVAWLPNGLDTVVGERGARLSGGERQRIALARALLARPRLLLLDEATSALDDENERRIHQAIDGLHGQVTVVVIAHRLSTLAACDRVLVLDRGRVVQDGDWASLRAAPGSVLTRLAGSMDTVPMDKCR